MESLPCWRATSIGHTAAALLTRPVAAGRILAVVSRAVYLESHGGEIVWLGDESLPVHGRSLLAPMPSSPPALQGRWSAADGVLFLPGSLNVAFGDATLWMPPSIHLGHLPPPSLPINRATAALATANVNPPAEGLAPLLPLVTGCTTGHAQESVWWHNSPLATLAASRLRAVVQACRQGHVTAAIAAAERLLGLGPGLTPAGDDFVGGLLFALHHLAAAYPQIIGRVDESTTALLARARACTNPVSYTILADLAAGSGPAPLHSFLLALFQGAAVPCIARRVRQLVSIGHTSGWDTLLGFLCGLLALDTPTIAS